MVSWNNLDTLKSFKKLESTKRVDLKAVMSGESGAKRVKNYSVPMACGLTFNYAAKAVDEDVLTALEELAKEALPQALAACQIVPAELGEMTGCLSTVAVALYRRQTQGTA